MKVASAISFMVTILHSILCQPEPGGRNFTVRGSTYIDVHIDLTYRTWVTFQVKTSKDAIIGLFQNNLLVYEIVIGGGNNTFTCVRHQHDGRCLTYRMVRRLVSANELRWFWIYWTKYFVVYGRGYRVEQNPIIHHGDRTPFINMMKIRSYDKNEGFWVIPQLYYDLGFRLVNGSLPTEGYLESFEYDVHNSGNWYWAPYSARSFEDHDAGVACFSLGFGRSGMIVSHRYGDIVAHWRIYALCKGYESNLRICSRFWEKKSTRNVFISCNKTVMQPSVTDEHGRLLLYPNGINKTYGNSVIQRDSSINGNYSFSSWINTITSLTTGTIKTFYLFIERKNSDPSLKRLQIWRPVPGSNYKLIWERIANVTGPHWSSQTLYKFDVSAEKVEVAAGDCIGWLNEDNNTWISASRCSADPCQCSRLYDFSTTYDWPVVDRTSAFHCRPYNFSVAVEIQPSTAVIATTITGIYSYNSISIPTVTTENTLNRHQRDNNTTQVIITAVAIVCVIVLLVFIAAVLIVTFICYKSKRGCFAKSSPEAAVQYTGAADNTYDLGPVAISSSSDQPSTNNPTTPSAAAADDRIYYNDSAAVSAAAGNGHVVIVPGEINTHDRSVPPAADAEAQYDTIWNASSPPQRSPVSEEVQSPDAAHGPNTESPQCHDSGLTLVEDKRDEPSQSIPTEDAVYVNAAFHAAK